MPAAGQRDTLRDTLTFGTDVGASNPARVSGTRAPTRHCHFQVLVVDDDDQIRELVALALFEEGYRVATAMHGEAALDWLARVRRQPDVILLDMRMPVMDGWTFAAAYRRRPGPHAPIVVLTAARDARARAAQIGADGVLAKPFELDYLLEVVGRFTGTN